MKKSTAVTCLLVLLALASRSYQQQPSMGDIWCGKVEGATPDKCDADSKDMCIKCSECLQGKISKGFVPYSKFAEETKNNGGTPPPSSLCISIWAWLGPVIAVVVSGIGLWIFCKCRKRAPAEGSTVAPSPRN